MSIALHFDALSVYGAGATRLFPVQGEPEDLVGEGGELQERFERVGQRPLLGVLRDSAVRRAVLADGELEIAVERAPRGGRLTVRWAGEVVVDTPVEIPPLAATHTGPWFRPEASSAVQDLAAALAEHHAPLFGVAEVGGQVRWFRSGTHGRGVGELPLRGIVPRIGPEDLGSEEFRAAHGVHQAYIAGAMAGGIASADMVVSLARAGRLGFFGAGGVPIERVAEALGQIRRLCGEGAWGANLLHNPVEPALEERTVDLYLQHGVRRVSASAYMGLTRAVVRYRLHGIHAGPDGAPVCPNRVLAKVSRPEVAAHFLRPAPRPMLDELVADGILTEAQAALARAVPVAMDVTAEGDSGGHTDHRPLLALLPVLQRQRDELTREHGYARAPRVGAAGGLGTPRAIWAAFALGADYVLTGSVNQATVEAGTSPLAKEMLAAAAFHDVASGPAPDMFEIGARVQVLSRGSMYAQRAQRLYDTYRTYGSIEAIPSLERQKLERQLFKRPLVEVWEGTKAYWQQRDPGQVERAEADPRHKLALTFRWYLGMTSRWARAGDPDRKRDFQVWCGPAMGAFNDWARGTALEPLSARTVVRVADALMDGAATHARAAAARAWGLDPGAVVDTPAPS